MPLNAALITMPLNAALITMPLNAALIIMLLNAALFIMLLNAALTILPLNAALMTTKKDDNEKAHQLPSVFTVAPALAGGLMRIEAVKQAIQTLPITPRVLANFAETARLFSAHYSTMIEGNRLTRQPITPLEGAEALPIARPAGAIFTILNRFGSPWGAPAGDRRQYQCDHLIRSRDHRCARRTPRRFLKIPAAFPHEADATVMPGSPASAPSRWDRRANWNITCCQRGIQTAQTRELRRSRPTNPVKRMRAGLIQG
jgi:hypothetical protein